MTRQEANIILKHSDNITPLNPMSELSLPVLAQGHLARVFLLFLLQLAIVILDSLKISFNFCTFTFFFLKCTFHLEKGTCLI